MAPMTLFPLIFFMMFFPFISACQKDDIAVYRVPKEFNETEGVPVPASAVEANSQRDIEWVVPPSWRVQAPSEMRVGSFLRPGKNGHPADISVVLLSGEAGGALANINRWRQQIQLPALSESEWGKNTKTISATGRKMIYVDMVSTEFLIEGKLRKRLIAAIYQQTQRTWFFKMSGEDESVKSAEPDFLAFLKSLQFKSEK